MEDNKIGNIEATEINGVPVVKSQDSVFPESFYFSKFYEEKAYKRFIQNTEKLIRTSKEYKTYIELLRTNLTALNLDNVMSNITNADAEMEFHHYPVTLYEIVDLVAMSKFLKKEGFTSFKIAREVMDLHFKNIVGLVPLTKTNHELAHNNALFFSTKQVFGNFKEMLKIYEDAVSTDLKNKVARIDEMTEQDQPSDIRGIL
jgi:hypothetical protein